MPTFMSYAQNYEDLVLWRVLQHIEHGFYIDIGAQHPTQDSVSKAFYDRGWRGISIEPVPEWANLLRAERPDEIIIETAIGDTNGIIEIHQIPGTGLTTAITSHAEQHKATLGVEVKKLIVPCLTLNAAVGNLVAGRDVHWLKIDVEGFEGNVLRGWDATILRPWVLVIEATLPMSREREHEKWEHWVNAADYQFVYFDGLNRFYVANEHADLSDGFYPPCVFDDCKNAVIRALDNRLATAEVGLIQSNQQHQKILASERARSDQFSAELAQFRAARDEQSEAASRLAADHAELQAAYQTIRAHADQVSSEYASLHLAHKALIERADQSIKTCDQIQNSRQIAEERAEHLTSNFATLQNLYQTQIEHAVQIAARYAELQTAWQTQADNVAHLTSNYVKLQQLYQTQIEHADQFAIDYAALQNVCKVQNERADQLSADHIALQKEYQAKAAHADHLLTEYHNLHGSYQAKAQHAEYLACEADRLQRHVAQLEQLNAALYSSTSWKIARPIRVTKHTLLALKSSPPRLIRPLVRRILENLLSFVRQHRAIAPPLHRVLGHFPKLQARLYLFAQLRDPRRVAPASVTPIFLPPESGLQPKAAADQHDNTPELPAFLTLRSRFIYHSLARAIAEHKDLA